MAKTFIDYLAENERTYSYRIKTIVPLDEKAMMAIEEAILKYDPVDISHQRKTIFQTNPPDFINAAPFGAEVYIVDVTLGLPASVLSLRMALCKALRVADKFVVVRGANDPIENDLQRQEASAAIAATAEEQGLDVEALLNDPHYKEAEEFVAADLYGDAYNTKFVAYLKKVEDERKKANAAKVPVTPLFDFLAPTQTAPETLPNDREADGDNPMNNRRSIQGNYDDDTRQIRRVFRTKGGKEKVLSAFTNGVRGGK